MTEWHVQHMEKTLVKYVKGLAENASSWERRNHKKYGKLANICKQIEYDIKHGAEVEQLVSTIHKVRSNSSFSELRNSPGALDRLSEVENHFLKPKMAYKWY